MDIEDRIEGMDCATKEQAQTAIDELAQNFMDTHCIHCEDCEHKVECDNIGIVWEYLGRKDN